jgi:hypothetical protein
MLRKTGTYCGLVYFYDLGFFLGLEVGNYYLLITGILSSIITYFQIFY